jgi:hypothetical protein
LANEDNYWLRRAASGRFNRRRFVSGAALAAAGATTLGLVGCGDDDSGGSSGKLTANATPTAVPTPAEAAAKKGK